MATNLIDEALDRHLELIGLLRGPSGGLITGLMLARTGDELGDIEYVETARHYADILTTAPTYVVTREMGALVRHAADELTADKHCPIPHRDLLPSPNGFLFLETPMMIATAIDDLREIPISGFWWTADNSVSVSYRAEDGNWAKASGITMGALVNRQNLRDQDREALESVGIRTQLVPNDVTAWVFDREWLEAPDHETWEKGFDAQGNANPVNYAHPAGAIWRRVMWSIWQLMADRIEARHGGRAARRRWMRAAPQAPDWGSVRVITLRKYATDGFERLGDPGEEGGRQWSHRWMVSGHLHRYWVGPAENKELIIKWVDAYPKGPDHLPLIIRDDVYLLRR